MILRTHLFPRVSEPVLPGADEVGHEEGSESTGHMNNTRSSKVEIIVANHKVSIRAEGGEPSSGRPAPVSNDRIDKRAHDHPKNRMYQNRTRKYSLLIYSKEYVKIM